MPMGAMQVVLQCFSRIVHVQVAYAELLQLEDEVFVSHPAFVRRLSGAASEPDAAAALYAEVRAAAAQRYRGCRPRCTAPQEACVLLCARWMVPINACYRRMTPFLSRLSYAVWGLVVSLLASMLANTERLSSRPHIHSTGSGSRLRALRIL